MSACRSVICRPSAKPLSTRQKQAAEPPAVEEILHVDTLELEVGYGLVRMIDTAQGGDLLDRITMIRRQLAGDMGLVMPPGAYPR